MSRRRPPKSDTLREAALLLHLDPDNLTEGDRLRCQLVATLRGAIDHEQAKSETGSSADLAKLVTAVEALTKLLPANVTAPESRYVGDPAARLAQIILGAVRRAPQSGPVEVSEVPEIDRIRGELADARAELAALRGTPQAPAQLALPAPDAIDPPSDANVTPLRAEPTKPGGPKTYHGPNGETWMEPGPNEPPQAKPGWLTTQQRDAVNNRPLPMDLRPRACDAAGGSAGFRVGGGVEPWREHVSGNNSFFWGGPSNRRSW
jgi:hypothetical protein